MVYVACVAAGVAVALEQGARHWRDQLALEMTVEFPAPTGESPSERIERLDAAMEQLILFNGIRGARLLNPTEIADLLQPWLDQTTRLEIQLPDLAAITLMPGASIDASELEARLRPLSPGATLDDHADFTRNTLQILGNVERVALALLCTVLFASALLVGFVAVTGLSIHRRVVEILNLFGADDDYIARQFQMQALRVGAPGAIVGAALAALTMHLSLAWLHRAQGLALPTGLDKSQIVTVAGVAVAAIAIAILTARLVVLAELRREG